MIIVAYRHALRASELCDLTWDAIDFRAATIHVKRRKHGQATTHQISGPELKALRKLQREQESKSHFVFITERDGEPFNRDGFNWMVKRTGKKAGLPFQVHAHMLRHSAGYTLANAGKLLDRPGWFLRRRSKGREDTHAPKNHHEAPT
jgi:type 1 fimbriae regulatory protein FimB/type 1 fimbriae regulatory protein FimE